MIETEIKFPVSDFMTYRVALEKLHAERRSSFFEDNIVFDDDEGSLRREHKLLRLRKSDRTTLTFKSPVQKAGRGSKQGARFKVMEEHEVEVSDFERAEKIISCLGYRKVFRYQKNREIYATGGVLVCFDETPIGKYLEIEGKKGRISGLCEKLHLSLEEGTSKNYMELYAEYCKKNNRQPTEMVF